MVCYLKTNARDHPRFKKAFSYRPAYGQKQAYKEEVEHLGSERLGGLIKICGFLMQTKVYLFWNRGVMRYLSMKDKYQCTPNEKTTCETHLSTRYPMLSKRYP